MAQNFITNDDMRSRMKKYDSYNHDSRFSYRKISASNNFKPKTPSVHVDVANKSSAIPRTTKPLQPHLTHKRNLPGIRTASSVSEVDPIALKAIKLSAPSEKVVFSEEFSTVYGDKKNKSSIFQKSLYGLGMLVIVFSAIVSVQTFMTNKYAKQQVATLGVNSDPQGVSEGTGSDPSEEPIPESVVSGYTVQNPEDPRYLRIPELKIFSRIKNLGVTSEGAVDAPKNIYDSGWYNGSARPGNSVGSSLILGHVSGWTGPGVFKNINKLKEGSRFEIEKGSGEKIYYEVTKAEQIPLAQVDMSKILATEVAGEHDLKLMTCSGKYNRETKEFEDRFVVYARQIK